jgi:hypothetical protein
MNEATNETKATTTASPAGNWAIFELMGHRQLAGRWTVLRHGPREDGRKLYRVRFTRDGREHVVDVGPQAIYSRTRCTEREARRVRSHLPEELQSPSALVEVYTDGVLVRPTCFPDEVDKGAVCNVFAEASLQVNTETYGDVWVPGDKGILLVDRVRLVLEGAGVAVTVTQQGYERHPARGSRSDIPY